MYILFQIRHDELIETEFLLGMFVNKKCFDQFLLFDRAFYIHPSI